MDVKDLSITINGIEVNDFVIAPRAPRMQTLVFSSIADVEKIEVALNHGHRIESTIDGVRYIAKHIKGGNLELIEKL